MSKTRGDLTSRWTGGPYYLTPEQRRRTWEMFKRKAKRKGEEQSSSDPAKILYLCDRRRCDNCSEDCRLTSDIRHAENFIKYNNVFYEKDAAGGLIKEGGGESHDTNQQRRCDGCGARPF